MRPATPCRAALRRATSRAAAETSVATTRACGNSCASATARQPEPVPTSAIAQRCCERAIAHCSFAKATSMTCSVSGRGISTSGVTSNSRPQNSCRPVRYWVGSPAARRSSRLRISGIIAPPSIRPPDARRARRGRARARAGATARRISAAEGTPAASSCAPPAASAPRTSRGAAGAMVLCAAIMPPPAPASTAPTRNASPARPPAEPACRPSPRSVGAT